MNLRALMWALARDYPGGPRALALAIGVNANHFYHQLKGTGSAKLGLEDSAAATLESGDLRMVEALNAELGLLVVRMPTFVGDGTGGCLDKLSSAAKEFSDFVSEVASDMSDARLSDNELGRIEREGAELLAAVHGLLKAARALNDQERHE